MTVTTARRALLRSAIAVGVVGAAVLGASAPAMAADGNVYVVVNNSVCGSNGGEVRGILISDAQSGFTTTAWDNGDNIVYPRVRLGTSNQLSIKARCDKRTAVFFWQTTGYPTVVARITPTKTGQTFWVG